MLVMLVMLFTASQLLYFSISFSLLIFLRAEKHNEHNEHHAAALTKRYCVTRFLSALVVCKPGSRW